MFNSEQLIALMSEIDALLDLNFDNFHGVMAHIAVEIDQQNDSGYDTASSIGLILGKLDDISELNDPNGVENKIIFLKIFVLNVCNYLYSFASFHGWKRFLLVF